MQESASSKSGCKSASSALGNTRQMKKRSRGRTSSSWLLSGVQKRERRHVHLLCSVKYVRYITSRNSFALENDAFLLHTCNLKCEFWKTVWHCCDRLAAAQNTFIGCKIWSGQADMGEGKQLLNWPFLFAGFLLKESWTWHTTGSWLKKLILKIYN